MRLRRLLFSSFFASFWILALLPQRRGEISLYVTRLAALCLWDVWKRAGGMHLKYASFFLCHFVILTQAILDTERHYWLRVPGHNLRR